MGRVGRAGRAEWAGWSRMMCSGRQLRSQARTHAASRGPIRLGAGQREAAVSLPRLCSKANEHIHFEPKAKTDLSASRSI